VFFYDSHGNRDTQSRSAPVVLCCQEGVADSLQDFWGDACALVADENFHARIAGDKLGDYGYFLRLAGERFSGIGEEIDEDLFEALEVAGN